jgi:hypothetical protein
MPSSTATDDVLMSCTCRFGGGFEMMQATQQVRDAFFPVMESFAK